MDKKVRYIYMITNPNGWMYIGKADDFEKRMVGYKSGCYVGQHALENSIKKYGWENHKVKIIWQGQSTDKQSYRLEKFFIKKYNTWKNGLNCNAGGKGFASGENHPHYGVKGKDHFNYGRRHTEEEISRMRGRVVSRSSVERTVAGINKQNKECVEMGCNNHKYGITKFKKHKILKEMRLPNWDAYIKYLSMSAA